MAKKSTVQIPVHKATGNVPHWCEGKEWCDEKIAEVQQDLADGFKPPPKTQWKPFHMENEQTWRKWHDDTLERYTYEWREPWEFVDTFQIEGYGRGRSAAYLQLKSKTTGMECVMMMRDMSHMILSANIFKGVVIGRWIFSKQGANYGIKYLGEK